MFLAAYAVGLAVWIYHMRWRALPWIAAFFGTVVIIANAFSYPYVIATMFALMAWALGYWIGSGWLWDKEDESS